MSDDFNKLFLQFLETLMSMFPEDTDFPLLTMGLKQLVSINPNFPVEVYRNNVTRLFLEQINNHDEQFFLTTEKLVQNEKAPPVTDRLIQKLRDMWRLLDEESRECMWLWVQMITNASIKK